MSHALKNSQLHLRARLLQQLRNFFAARNVLEVETPLLATSTATDPHITSIKAGKWFLQTSPEFAMKRLLAADSGPIYQICKAFRDGEQGRLHNPEFTLLEWYQPGFNHHQLMNEVDELLQTILNTETCEHITYREVFITHLDIDPAQCTVADLIQCAEHNKISPPTIDEDDKDSWLNLLLSHCIEPKLGLTKPLFIYDYPASQAALAKIRDDKIPVAERFEVYFRGIELANGYHELNDAREQQQRFNSDNLQRKKMLLPEVPTDMRLIAALDDLPDCAGVALGVDRLMMLAHNCNTISDTLSFDISQV